MGFGIDGAPCKDCKDRVVDPNKGKVCEDTCPKWQEWIVKKAEIKKQSEKDRDMNHMVKQNKSYRW